MKSQTIIFSHANCMDGLAAAWAMWTVFGNQAEYIFCHYDNPVWTTTDVVDKDVYFVDFSAPRQDLIDMCQLARSVTVADHHKTAQAALDNADKWAPNNLLLTFDMTKSGARLAMEMALWLRTEQYRKIPVAIHYVEDRDLWNWKLPHSKEISSFLASFDRTIEGFDRSVAQLEYPEGFEAAVAIGQTLNEDVKRRVTAKVKSMHRMLDAKGREVYMCNATELGSEIGNDALLEHPDASYTVTYFDKYEGDSVLRVFSLRARKGGTDVSAIAKANGGGGHAAAAGFTVTAACNMTWKV